MYFLNRQQAGEELASLLKKYQGKEVVVYALPRGGVVVGAEIAQKLKAPLDLIITRKIGHPNQGEYAIGAVAENGHFILDPIAHHIDQNYLKNEMEVQRNEARRRREVYLGGRKPISCKGKVAILADDGIATGFTMKVAILELQKHFYPQKIVVAVPVLPKEIVPEIKSMGVELVTLEIADNLLGSIGAYYQDFSPVEDETVIQMMQKNSY